MRVSIIRNGSIRDFIFPNEAKGSYWIDGFDINGNKRNIILIDSDNGKWKLVSNNNAYVVVNDVMNPFVYLDNYMEKIGSNKCPVCGEEIVGKGKFCANCGATL